MTNLRRRLRNLVLITIFAGGSLLATAAPAFASDEGNWTYGSSCTLVAACFWRTAEYANPGMESNTRDSDFSNDYYQWSCNGHQCGLNDGVTVWKNNFTTLYVQAFLDANYGRPSFCLPGQYFAGPYPLQNPNGLSSFKSC